MTMPDQSLPSATPQLPSASRRRRRRWPWILLAAVVLLVGVPLVIRQVLIRRAERRLADVVANLSFPLVAAGDIPTLWGPAPAEADNAAPIYNEAFAKLSGLIDTPEDWEGEEPSPAEALWDTWTRMEVIWGLEDLGGREHLFVENPDELDYANLPADLVPPRDVAEARKFLAVFDEVFALRDRAVARPSYRENLDWSQGIGTELQNLVLTMRLVRLTLLQCAVDAEAGQWEAAYERIHCCLAMVRHVEQEPILIQVMVGAIIRGMAVDGLARVIDRQPPLPEMARRLRSLLVIGAASRMRSACAGEAAMCGQALDEIVSGRLTPSDAGYFTVEERGRIGGRALVWVARPLLIEAKAQYLAILDRFARAADKPAPDALAEMEVIEEDVCALDDSGWTGRLVAMLLPNMRAALIRFTKDNARGQMVLIALDVAAHRKAGGTYPASLSDLPSADALPRDPFSGEPFNYRREPKGFVLWSVGPDGDDDGGLTREELTEVDTSQDDEDGDVVLRVPPKKPKP